MDPTSLLQCFVDWEVQISTGVPVVWQGLKAVIEKMGVARLRFLNQSMVHDGSG